MHTRTSAHAAHMQTHTYMHTHTETHTHTHTHTRTQTHVCPHTVIRKEKTEPVANTGVKDETDHDEKHDIPPEEQKEEAPPEAKEEESDAKN